MKLSIPLFLFALSTAAQAQWRTTTYTLQPGWNSIYLNGDATYLTVDQHFASKPDVEEVWRWNPNPSAVEFTTDPSNPTPGIPEWSVWRRSNAALSDLTQMTGQTAYLVKLRTGAPSTSLLLKQRVEPPVLNWVRTGANFLGFPSKKNGANFPTFSNYFATLPAATGSKIYRYNGGPLDANNPVRIFSITSERLDSTQAYWFEAKTVNDFIGPVSTELSDPTGLSFGKSGSSVSLTMRNRTAVPQTMSLAPMASEAAPSQVTGFVGPVVLTRRVLNTTTGAYDDLPFSAAYTEVIPANSTATITFGVNRTALVGPPGSLFASLVRVTDAANMMDVYLPATAGSASIAGLWVGDAEVTNVESKAPGFVGTNTSRSVSLRYIIHVNDAGQATLLSQVYQGPLATTGNAWGITPRESSLQQDALAKASRITAAHMPLDRVLAQNTGSFGAGGTLNFTINLPFDDPTSPFVHQYHPDHDNKDSRFKSMAASSSAAESWTVNRDVRFTFAATPPVGAAGSNQWGSRVLGGTYSETLRGIYRKKKPGGTEDDSTTVSGTFTLYRISETGVLTP